MRFDTYTEQVACWPTEGRHILAQSDATHVVVYQAYRPSIADHAVAHQRFGGDFSFSRMSWIKPNFLWMMFRSGWAGKEGQERILALTLKRTFFEGLLLAAVPSGFQGSGFDNKEAWEQAVQDSDVRLQWDPDHDPFGAPVARRAIQLGLRGETLAEFATDALLGVDDITAFVHQQRANVNGGCERLLIPSERVYVPGQAAARRIGLDPAPADRNLQRCPFGIDISAPAASSISAPAASSRG